MIFIFLCTSRPAPHENRYDNEIDALYIRSQEKHVDHPHLTREDILAAHEFAADYLANEEVAFI